MNERYEAWLAKLNDVPHDATPMEVRQNLDQVLDEYAQLKREMFLPGFADYVLKQGYGAVSPNKIKATGKFETWQACGRRIWGETHFNKAMREAIARSRGAKTSSKTSQGSASLSV